MKNGEKTRYGISKLKYLTFFKKILDKWEEK